MLKFGLKRMLTLSILFVLSLLRHAIRQMIHPSKADESPCILLVTDLSPRVTSRLWSDNWKSMSDGRRYPHLFWSWCLFIVSVGVIWLEA